MKQSFIRSHERCDCILGICYPMISFILYFWYHSIKCMYFICCSLPGTSSTLFLFFFCFLVFILQMEVGSRWDILNLFLYKNKQKKCSQTCILATRPIITDQEKYCHLLFLTKFKNWVTRRNRALSVSLHFLLCTKDKLYTAQRVSFFPVQVLITNNNSGNDVYADISKTLRENNKKNFLLHFPLL